MNASQAYLNHLGAILDHGIAQEARGLSFVELIAAQYIVPMWEPVIMIPKRELGFKFAAAEPYWILSGNNLLSGITDYGKMSPYSDDGYTMSGAYGPKIVDQLAYVCKTLADDRGSRQAVINIWRERPGPSKDIPCTLSLQFMIRNDRLNCIATMRSSDAMMGLPYDSILFSLTSAYILSIMRYHYGVFDVRLGSLYLTMGSAHLYDRDIDKAAKIVEAWDFRVSGQLDLNLLTLVKPETFLGILNKAKDQPDGILSMTGFYQDFVVE